MFVFSPEFTKQSKLAPAYLAVLNELCQRDYGKAFFPNAIVCLDLDAYESACTGENDATMDAAAGMADFQSNRVSSCRHLLVELRFDYQSIHNLDLKNMKRKVSHSRDILMPERVNEKVAFLFNDRVAPQAINFFSRLAKQDQEIRSWKAMDVNGFNSFIVDRSSLPYQPENDLNVVVTDLNKKFAEGGIDELDAFLKYWIEQMHQYNLRYKHAESDAVARVMVEALQELIINDSFEKDYLALRIEEIQAFIHE